MSEKTSPLVRGKYLFFFLAPILLLASFNSDGNKTKAGGLTERNFNQFNWVYHFYKQELEESRIEPTAYKPKVFNTSGQVQAKLYARDTLIRFVYKSKKEQSDSTVELLRLVKLADTDSSMIPPELLGCHLIGVYNSLNEDMPDNFYYCIYLNENDDLLRVLHLYKLGNVSAAFFYTKNDVDPTNRYKSDIAKLLAAQRKLNLTDTLDIKFD